MSDMNKEVPRIGAVATQPSAEKVRSSRYEWESKSGESEHKPEASGRPQRSLLTSLGAWVKKYFFGGRDLFDNDDDASPSAA